jgi:hypothetical protein
MDNPETQVTMVGFMVLKTTFNNISVISWRQFYRENHRKPPTCWVTMVVYFVSILSWIITWSYNVICVISV